MKDLIQERPNIDSTLSSLKSAMTAEKDQVLEDETLNSGLENSVSDESVNTAFNEVLDEREEVFCSEKSEDEFSVADKEENSAPIKAGAFVLTRMIQEDGTILNIDIPKPKDRPSVHVSDEKMEAIIRDEAKPFIKDWIERHMHKVVKK